MTGQVRDRYLRFAHFEAHGHSPTYERLSLAIADDPATVKLLESLPEDKQQPNLLFGVSRLLGAPMDQVAKYNDWLRTNWPDVYGQILARSTQTNEPRRMATLLPLMSEIQGPIALLEVGASAGLCLYPDGWSYEFSGTANIRLGDVTRPTLRCQLEGSAPSRMAIPTVVWRAGIDLNPLCVTNDDHRRWLQSLVWPEQVERRHTLDVACQIASQDPPTLVEGDLLEELESLADRAPRDATLVIFHSAVITYLSMSRRLEFVELVRGLDARWISNEGPNVIPLTKTPSEVEVGRFLTMLDGVPFGWAQPHGQAIRIL